MHGRILSAAFLTAILASGCDHSSPGSSDAVAVEAVSLSYDSGVRIGSLNDPEQSLTRIGQVLIGPDGRLYISQPMDRTIRVHDHRGVFLSAIGGDGEGPGEFADLGSISLVADTLVALDSGLGRLTRFLFDGTYVDTRPWRPEIVHGDPGVVLVPGVPQEFVLSPTGASMVKPGMSILPNAQMGTLRVPYLLLDPLGQVTDTLAWQPMTASIATLNRGGRAYQVESPFQDDPLYALAPDGSGLVVVHRNIPEPDGSPNFSLLRITPSGDTLSSSVFSYFPAPMPEDVVARIVAGATVRPSNRSEGPTVDEIESALRREGLVPVSSIPVTGIAVGQDGTVWLRREEMEGDSVSWDIIPQSNGRIARVTLPEDETVVAARNGVFVTKERDEFDVEYVKLYRLRRGAEGL